MERSIVPMMDRDINGVQKAAGPATQLSVVLDGNRVWGSEFGDAGVAAGNPVEHVHLLGIRLGPWPSMREGTGGVSNFLKLPVFQSG